MYFDCASSEQGFKIVPARVLYGIRLLLELILNDKRGVHLSIDRWWNSQTFRHDYSYQSWPHSFTRTLLMFFAMFCKLHFYVINLSQWPCIILWGQLYSKSFDIFSNFKVWGSSFFSTELFVSKLPISLARILFQFVARDFYVLRVRSRKMSDHVTLDREVGSWQWGFLLILKQLKLMVSTFQILI